MENLKIYDQVREVPKEAKKDIQAGRLKGKTDINPMWRIKKLTEIFGPCGIGWKYVITKQWIEHGGKDEIAAFVNIDLFVKSDGAWSEAIPGTGGSSFVANEKNGPYVSDECFKMALTDAISVSCKALGFGADVYWDKDSTKYDRAGNKATSQPRTGQTATSNANIPSPISESNMNVPSSQGMKCSVCDDDITEKIYKYSKSKFGKPLCFKCQKGGK